MAVQSIDARAGNACVVLTWAELPEGSVKGYNVYRVSNGKAVKLTSVPQAFFMYADTGLTNGTAYQYEVSSVDKHGRESARSSRVSAIPSASVASLNWVSPPASVSGNARIYASPAGGMVTGLTVLIDGAEYGSAGLSDPSLFPLGSIEAVFDASGLSNGKHMVQIIGYSATGMVATQPLFIVCDNAVSDFTVNDLIDLTSHEVAHVHAILPARTVKWTVKIANAGDEVVFTRSGVSPNVRCVWDTRMADGKRASPGIYTLTLSIVTSPAPSPGSRPADGAKIVETTTRTASITLYGE